MSGRYELSILATKFAGSHAVSALADGLLCTVSVRDGVLVVATAQPQVTNATNPHKAERYLCEWITIDSRNRPL